jgi:DNA polymerase III gamma/tau subunit
MTAERDSLRDAVKRRDEVITLLHDELGRVRDVVGCVDVALIDDVFEAAKLKEAPK